jgi:hypothetical protein
MSDRDIEITLDEVVLDGPFGARREAIREALAAHLGRLVAERGLPAGAPAELRLPKVALEVSSELGTEALAAKVAGELYARLAGPAWPGARGGTR